MVCSESLACEVWNRTIWHDCGNVVDERQCLGLVMPNTKSELGEKSSLLITESLKTVYNTCFGIIQCTYKMRRFSY